MRLLAQPIEAPGVCVLTASSAGPVIETGRVNGVGPGTQYVAADAVRELAAFLGYVDGEDFRRAAAERDELAAQLAELREEHQALLNAVGYTLKFGATVKGKAVELRTRAY